MTEPETNLSRRNRKKKQDRESSILNVLIGIVIVLIIVVSSMILSQGDKSIVEEGKPLAHEGETTENEETDELNLSEEPSVSLEEFEIEEGSESEVDVKSGIITYINPTEKYVKETLVDPSWKPIGTVQSGDHVSKYDGTSDDWEEKKEALAYATGLTLDSMEFWRIKNGGSPHHSIGIVSSLDLSEKYRVYLEWVEEQGWKPVKMDVLRTLDFDY